MISPEDARSNIAANLQRILKERGLTQTRLAELTGQPLMTINYLVRGKQEPRIALLASVAEALDVSIDRLVGSPPFPSIVMHGHGSQKNLPSPA